MATRTAWVFLQRALLAFGVLMLLGLAVLPRLGAYRTATVLTASMHPTFAPGDMVVTVPEPVSSVRVGQVISYRVPVGEHQIETHRVVKIVQGQGTANPVIQTRGDANQANDPWTARLQGATAWRQVAVIPKLGYVLSAMRGRAIEIAAVLIAPIVLVVLLLSEIWSGAGDEPTSDEQRERRERRVSREPYFGPERRIGGDRRIGRSRAPRPALAWQTQTSGVGSSPWAGACPATD
jgi:signal peptidase I